MKNTGQRKPCQLHQHWVSFEDFGWDWIIAATASPQGLDDGPGFYMNFCAGYCPHPMPAHMNNTNHAVFQQLMHRTGEDVDPPCCIPVEYEAIDILTTNFEEIKDLQFKEFGTEGDGMAEKRDFSKAESVELRKFEEMSAVSCGCH